MDCCNGDVMPKPQKQIGALPWRIKKGRIEILLVTSRETKRWVIPKGWPIEHLTNSNAAKLEALEEAGATGHIKRKPLGAYDYDKRLQDGSAVRCRVEVFAMEVVQSLKKWPEKGQRRREWYSVDDAVWHVDEAGLKDIIATFSPK
jgi:predicted NUDIX family NTP pyrophosphohydrolase